MTHTWTCPHCDFRADSMLTGPTLPDGTERRALAGAHEPGCPDFTADDSPAAEYVADDKTGTVGVDFK